MLFGVRLYGNDPDGLIVAAQRAEKLGYDSMWRGEHFVIPAHFDKAYPYTPDGKPPFAVNVAILDTITLMSFVACATTKLKFASGISILPLHNVFVLARSALTLDRLSKGRFMLGLGVGWMREEFEMLGANFNARGKITTEMMLALKALWTEDYPKFAGDFIKVDNVHFEPKPVARPHIPLIVGGESEAALRRAAQHGDGWYGHASEIAHFRGQMAMLERERAAAGRGDLPFQASVRVKPDVDLDFLKQVRDLGIYRAVLEIGRFGLEDSRDLIPDMERFAERVFGAGLDRASN